MNTDRRGGVVLPALLITILLMVVCGLLYPLAVTGLGQLLMHDKANGSLITVDGKPVGSEIVGQALEAPYFMQGRPSAVGYNTFDKDEAADLPASGSHNYASSNPALHERITDDIAALLEENPGLTVEDIPVDLVTESGSGLDPHISVESAMIQLPRISRESGLSMEILEEIVTECTEGKLLGIFGQDKVNVLKVNLEIAEHMGLIDSYES